MIPGPVRFHMFSASAETSKVVVFVSMGVEQLSRVVVVGTNKVHACGISGFSIRQVIPEYGKCWASASAIFVCCGAWIARSSEKRRPGMKDPLEARASIVKFCNTCKYTNAFQTRVRFRQQGQFQHCLDQLCRTKTYRAGVEHHSLLPTIGLHQFMFCVNTTFELEAPTTCIMTHPSCPQQICEGERPKLCTTIDAQS